MERKKSIYTPSASWSGVHLMHFEHGQPTWFSLCSLHAGQSSLVLLGLLFMCPLPDPLAHLWQLPRGSWVHPGLSEHTDVTRRDDTREVVWQLGLCLHRHAMSLLAVAQNREGVLSRRWTVKSCLTMILEPEAQDMLACQRVYMILHCRPFGATQWFVLIRVGLLVWLISNVLQGYLSIHSLPTTFTSKDMTEP